LIGTVFAGSEAKKKNKKAMTEEEIKNTQEEEQEPVVNGSPVDEETANDAPAEEPAEEKDPLEVAKAEIEELKTQMLYKTAEFDNYRKRTLKEKAELILNGGEKAVSAILPIIDDMERAIDNGAKTDDPAVLREGMELIYNKFMKALESLGVKKIDTADADFNTDQHEAVAMVPGMGDDKKGKVIDCLQAGYMLNDKVIRHAKVAVGQ
jgi:molecular chaperone GrpE